MVQDPALLGELREAIGEDETHKVLPLCVSFLRSPESVLSDRKLGDVLQAMSPFVGEPFAAMVSAMHHGIGALETIDEYCTLMAWVEHIISNSDDREQAVAAGLAKDATQHALVHGSSAHIELGQEGVGWAQTCLGQVSSLRGCFVDRCEQSQNDQLLRNAVSFLHAILVLITNEREGMQMPEGYESLSIEPAHPVFTPDTIATEITKCFTGFDHLILNPAVEMSTVMSLLNATTGLTYYRPTLWPNIIEFLSQVLEVAFSQDEEIWESLSVVWRDNTVRELIVKILRDLAAQPQLPAEQKSRVLASLAGAGLGGIEDDDVPPPPDAPPPDLDEDDDDDDGLPMKRSRSPDDHRRAKHRRVDPRTPEDEPAADAGPEYDASGKRVYRLNLPNGQRLSIEQVKEWIWRSIAMINKAGEPMQKLHEQGIERAQQLAARREQDKEIKHALAEGTGAEGDEGEVGAADLLAHVELKDFANGKGRELVAGLTSRSRDSELLMRTAYSGVATGALSLSLEGPAARMHGAALLARLLVQADDTAPVSEVRHMLIQNAGVDLRRDIDALLQMLYAAYASLAPFELASDPRLSAPGYEGGRDVAPTPDCELRWDSLLYWTDRAPRITGGFSFTEGDPAEEAESRYCRLFAQLIRDLGARLLDLDGDGDDAEPLLTQLLLGAPSIPPAAWRAVDAAFCSTDDRDKVHAGLSAVCAVAAQRPASSNQAMSYLLHYASGGSGALARIGAINFIIQQLAPASQEIADTCADFSYHRVEKCLGISQSVAVGELENALGNALSFFLALATQPDEKDREDGLISQLFDVAERVGSGLRRHELCLLKLPDLQSFVHCLGCQPTLLQRLVDYPHHHQGAGNFALRVLRQLIGDTKRELAEQYKNGADAATLQRTDRELLVLKGAGLDLKETTQDVRFLMLVLSLIPHKTITKECLPEVMAGCTHPGHVRVAIEEAVSPPPHGALGKDGWVDTNLGLTPVEMLVYLHQLAPGREHTPGAQLSQRQVMEALDCCVTGLPHLFTPAVLARALPQLALAKPVPALLMRTALRSVEQHPQMLRFVLRTVLPPLRLRRVWEGTKPSHKVLWEGVARIVTDHAPLSFEALLHFPPRVIVDLCRGMHRRGLAKGLLRFLRSHQDRASIAAALRDAPNGDGGLLRKRA